MNIFVICFLVSHSLLLIFACEHQDDFKEVEIFNSPDPNWKPNNDYMYEDDYTPPPTSRIEKVLSHRVIICSQLRSTASISYPYAELPAEQELKIEDSNISRIEQSAFLIFTTITKLFLENNHIQVILPGAFNGLTRLRELHLGGNELKEVAKGVFNSLHKLEVLTLNNNKIHKIENMAFTGADSLEELHLQNNAIEKTEDGLLKTQKHLRYLDLSNNPLVEFSMEGLSKLEILKVANTLVKNFDYDLSSLTMKVVDLKSCRLSEVDFSNFPKLDSLDLSSNKIVNLTNCHNLDSTDVNLSGNVIETVDGTFSDVSHFDISHNSLTIIQNLFFNESQSILTINFSFNKIVLIEKLAFENLRSLYTLLLQYNSISKIDPILFKDLVNLRNLNLSFNEIEEFAFGTFDSLSNLQTLDISGNKLVDLHVYTFSSLSHLFDLSFDNNQISSLDVHALKSHLPSLHVVSLDRNPWDCETLVKIIQSFEKRIQMSNGYSFDVENFHGIACQNKKSLKIYPNDQNSINASIQSSQMKKFLNEDFQNSKFFQYFDKDFMKSNFFKYFNGHETTSEGYQSLNNSRMEKLTSGQIVPNKFDKILIFSVVTQIIIVCILICGFFFMASYLKNVTRGMQQKQLSQMELY